MNEEKGEVQNEEKPSANERNGDVSMKEESSDSDSSSDSEAEVPETPTGPSAREILGQAQAAVDRNVYDYNAHITLIELARTLEDYSKLRSSREIMAQTFPLTEKLWVDWIKDEIQLKQIDFEAICQLFETGVKDYLSPNLWLEYCEYASLELVKQASPESYKKVREIFETALIALGAHVSFGGMLFDSFRDLEEVIPQSQEEKSGRILKLFQRQLALPLMGMEQTWADFQETMGENTELKKEYNKSLNTLSKLKPFEEKLSKDPDVDTYQEYLELELSLGNPSRVCCLFERAIQDHCLLPNLWCKYIQYTCTKLKNYEVGLSICKRAIRNVPWSPELWKQYLIIGENSNYSVDNMKSIMVESGPSLYGVDSCDLYLSFFSFLRRQYSKVEEESEKKILLKLFREYSIKAVDSHENFPDSLNKLRKFIAITEVKHFQNFDKFRKLFDNFILENSSDTERWIEYITLEEHFGTSVHVQKLFQRAFMYPRMSQPERLVEKCEMHEWVYGSLASIQTMKNKCEAFMLQVEKVRQADKEKNEKINKAKLNKASSEAKQKRPAPDENGEIDVFKMPGEPPAKKKRTSEDTKGSTSKTKTLKTTADSQSTASEVNTPIGDDSTSAKIAEKEVSNAGARSSENLERQESKDKNVLSISNEENAERSIFLSNLDFKVTEEKIREMFDDCGKISGVSLAKNLAGKSKGFGNVIFASKESVLVAMKLNRQPLEGRPVFVSHFKPSKKEKEKQEPTINPSAKLIYSTGLEKHKLFVSGLATTTTKLTIEEKFSVFGLLKDVRIVTYKNGHSKGLAFVEFTTEDDARKALLALDGSLLDGKEIKVAISNPPSRKTQDRNFDDEKGITGGSTDSSSYQDRKPKIQLSTSMMPRAVGKPSSVSAGKAVKPSQSSKSEKGSELVSSEKSSPEENGKEHLTAGSGGVEPLSNADFAKLYKSK